MGDKESKPEKGIRPTSWVLLAILGCVIALGILILFLANQQRKEVDKSDIRTAEKRLLAFRKAKKWRN